MICETEHVHNTDCVEWLGECCRVRTCYKVILYFMDDFSRARLWTGAMKLAHLVPRLQQLDTVVVLVGDVADGGSARLGVAARLAEKLELPFPLVADCQHSLWRRYATGTLEPAGKRAGLIVVDRHGQPVSGWPLQQPEQSLDLPALFEVLKALEVG